MQNKKTDDALNSRKLVKKHAVVNGKQHQGLNILSDNEPIDQVIAIYKHFPIIKK
jgi:hypothetical protein